MTATNQVRFRCPDCDKLLCVPAERADRRVKCPGCGNTFQPPTPEVAPPPAPEPTPEARPPEPSPPPPAEGPQKLARLTESLDEKGKEALPVLMHELGTTGSANFGRLLTLMTDDEIGKLARMINAVGPKMVSPLAKMIATTSPEAIVASMRQPTPTGGGGGETVGGVISVIIGLVFVGGGLSGSLVLKGTNSGVALAVVGVFVVLYGFAKIFGLKG